MRFALFVLLAVSACESKPQWIATRATQIHVGPWVAEIPKGWRDIHESVEKVEALPAPGSRSLIPEDRREWGRIDVFPTTPITGDGCTDFAKLVEGQTAGKVTIENAQAATFAGDRGCMMRISIDRTHGLLLIRSHGAAAVIVRCLGPEADLDGGSACDKMIYGLRLGS